MAAERSDTSTHTGGSHVFDAETGRRIWIKDDGFRGGYEACPRCGNAKKVPAKLCVDCVRADPTINANPSRPDIRYARCGDSGGLSRDRSPCRHPAGRRTDHLGFGKCATHGGNSPSGVRQALIQMGEAKVRQDLAKAGRAAPRNIAPEEAIQWLLDVGWLRANKWEDHLADWDNLSPAEKSTLVALSMGERKELREIAGLARKTGYRPQQQARDLAQLVYESLARALEDSGLADDPRVGPMWDSLLDSFRIAERDDALALAGVSEPEEAPAIIEGRVLSIIDAQDYGTWPLRALRNEIMQRDLDMPGDGKVRSRRALVRIIEADDAASGAGCAHSAG